MDGMKGMNRQQIDFNTISKSERKQKSGIIAVIWS